MLQIHVSKQDRFLTNTLAFYIHEIREGNRAVGEPVTMRTVTEAMSDTAGPTFELSYQSAQHLMDALWDVGLRPSEGSGSAGALKQAEDHIASLKKIVFALVESDKSKQPLSIAWSPTWGGPSTREVPLANMGIPTSEAWSTTRREREPARCGLSPSRAGMNVLPGFLRSIDTPAGR
jgi:hypothetical protein